MPGRPGPPAVDNALMRITDVIYAFPDLLFVIIILAVLVQNILFARIASSTSCSSHKAFDGLPWTLLAFGENFARLRP